MESVVVMGYGFRTVWFLVGVIGFVGFFWFFVYGYDDSVYFQGLLWGWDKLNWGLQVLDFCGLVLLMFGCYLVFEKSN